MKPRILFVSEAITLAQIVRLVTLARSLDPARYDVHFASGQFPGFVFREGEFSRWPLETVPGEEALARLAKGGRLYDRRTLERYVEADRAVIAAVKPTLVVGDLRWSLAISAAVERVPHAAIANAYMSPFAVRDGFPLPDHPIVSLLGEKLAARHFPRALPKVFDFFAAPVNRLRVAHGLPPVGSLLEVLVHGDATLYVDPPELVPMREMPAHHRFLGPVLWSAPGQLPEGWGADPGRPAIYVTAGSSGDIRLVSRIIAALADEPVDVLIATAGRTELASPPPSIRLSAFVPGAEAAARARLVISNGGSTTGYQALAVGTPVLGLPQNLEQHMASEAMARTGASRSIPARRATAPAIRAAVRELVADEPAHAAAHAAAALFSRYDAAGAFRSFVDGMVGRSSPEADREPDHHMPARAFDGEAG